MEGVPGLSVVYSTILHEKDERQMDAQVGTRRMETASVLYTVRYGKKALTPSQKQQSVAVGRLDQHKLLDSTSHFLPAIAQ